MAKKANKSTYIEEFKSDIKALTAEANRYVMLIAKHDFSDIKKLSRIEFANTHEGYVTSKKYEKKIDHLSETYKKLSSYRHAAAYTDISKEFMDALKDVSPSDNNEDPWKDVYRRYKTKLDDVKHDITVAYQDYLSEYRELIHFVNEKQRKEAIEKMTKDGQELSIQEYAEYSDEIKKIIYEKCNAGDYSLETREKLLNRLDEYKMSRLSAPDQIFEAVDNFINGSLDCDGLETILEGYYDENPDIESVFCPDHIDDMHEMMRESVTEDLHAGIISKKEAAKQLASVNAVYECDLCDYYADLYACREGAVTESVEEEEPIPSKLHEIYEAYTLCLAAVEDQYRAGYYTESEADAQRERFGNKFEELVDSFTGESVEYERQNVRSNLKSWMEDIQVLQEDGTMTDVDAYEMYMEAVNDYYDTMGDILEESKAAPTEDDKRVVDINKLRKADGVLTGMMVAREGKSVGAGKWKRAIEIYDEIHKPAVPFNSLKFRKASQKKDAELIEKYCRKAMTNHEDTNCNGLKEQPTYETYIAESNGSTFFVAIKMSTNSKLNKSGKKNYTLSFQGASPEFKKHEKYYRAGFSYKILKDQTGDSKDFLRSVVNDSHKIIKNDKVTARKISKVTSSTQDKLNKMMKESEAGPSVIYAKTVDKINALYESGKISLDKREDMTLEARRRIFG